MMKSIERLLSKAKSSLSLIHLDDVANQFLVFQHMFSYFCNLLRGNNIETIDQATVTPLNDNISVLLVHGFLGTAGSMFVLKKRLLSDGVKAFSVDLGKLNIRDIRTSAFLIYHRVEAILKESDQSKIDIIGYSMGGLIALYYILCLGGHKRVRRILMLGSPIRGTWSALWGISVLGVFCKSVWQLLPGSHFLKDLLAKSLPEEVEFYTIAAEEDWICPPGSTYLEGAQHYLFPLGHSSLILSTEIYAKIQDILRRNPL